jgi:transcriptional regulator with XRE-family HTH domain
MQNMLINNVKVAERIRKIGKQRGFSSDAAICEKCGFDRVMLIMIAKLKTAPQIDTLLKFANGLDCSMEEFIKDLSETHIKLIKILENLGDDKKNQLIGFILAQDWDSGEEIGKKKLKAA